MILPGHPPSSGSLARAVGGADRPPGGACSGALKPLTYGARKQPHVRFPLPEAILEDVTSDLYPNLALSWVGE